MYIWIVDMDIFCGHHHFGFGNAMGLYLFLMLNDITTINPNNAVLPFHL